MNISKDKVATFHYTINNADNTRIESSEDGEPITYLHGHGGLLPGLEKALEGQPQGGKVSVVLPPAQAYGEILPDCEQRIPLKHLTGAKNLKPGMLALVNTDQGQQQVKVLKIGHTMATVDTNHPLAGMTLKFDLEVLEVREATQEEISHGHSHGPGGHHH